MTGLTKVAALLRSLEEEMARLDLGPTSQPLDFAGIESDPTSGATSVSDFKSAVQQAIFAGRKVVPEALLKDSVKAAEVAGRQLDASRQPPAQTAPPIIATDQPLGETLQTTELAKAIVLKQPKEPAFAIEVIDSVPPAAPSTTASPALLQPSHMPAAMAAAEGLPAGLPQVPAAPQKPAEVAQSSAAAVAPEAAVPQRAEAPSQAPPPAASVAPQVPDAPLPVKVPQEREVAPPAPLQQLASVQHSPSQSAAPAAALAVAPEPSQIPDELVKLMRMIYSIQTDENARRSYIVGLQEKSGDPIATKTKFPRHRGACDSVFPKVKDLCSAFTHAKIEATLKEGQIHLHVTVPAPKMPLEYAKEPGLLEIPEERTVHEVANFLLSLPCQIQLHFAPFHSMFDAERMLKALSRRTKEWNIDEIAIRMSDSHYRVGLFWIASLIEELDEQHVPLLIKPYV